MGGLGCHADGKNVQCRFCGAGAYEEIQCPPSSCHFINEPFVPYYWDTSCKMGMLGCWADGIHAQCRFCGDHPYTSLSCPSVVGGQGPRPGPSTQDTAASCNFENEPLMPYFWDDDCQTGKLGCLADGVHPQCRFCAKRPFESIECPMEVAPPRNRCTFPKGMEPPELYYWDETCDFGVLGCWADGIHAQCRFCGGSTYWNVTCPSVRFTGAAAAGPEHPLASVAHADRPMPGLTNGPEDEEIRDLSAAPTLCLSRAVGAVMLAMWATWR